MHTHIMSDLCLFIILTSCIVRSTSPGLPVVSCTDRHPTMAHSLGKSEKKEDQVIQLLAPLLSRRTAIPNSGIEDTQQREAAI